MAAEITGITKTLLSNNKIDSGKETSSNTIASNVQNSDRAQKIINTTTPGSTDKISLTQQAKELLMIEKLVYEQTEIDNERVENLRLAIDAGQYNINTQRVAEKLIEFEMMFVA